MIFSALKSVNNKDTLGAPYRYRAFGTDIVRNLAKATIPLLFSRHFVSPRPRIASPALLEKCLSSSAFV